MVFVLSETITASKAVKTLATRCLTETLPKHHSSSWQKARFLSTVGATVGKVATNVSLPPLSAMPTGMLLRSLLVATISSNRFLLLPSLSILSFLCKPGRGFLLSVDKNPLLHAVLKKTFYEQFCAGETKPETKHTVQQFKDLGFRGVILTYAKETVFNHSTKTEQALGVAEIEMKEKDGSVETKLKKCANTEAWRKGTLETIDLLGEGDYLAMKYVRCILIFANAC